MSRAPWSAAPITESGCEALAAIPNSMPRYVAELRTDAPAQAGHESINIFSAMSPDASQTSKNTFPRPQPQPRCARARLDRFNHKRELRHNIGWCQRVVVCEGKDPSACNKPSVWSGALSKGDNNNDTVPNNGHPWRMPNIMAMRAVASLQNSRSVELLCRKGRIIAINLVGKRTESGTAKARIQPS